MRAGLSSAPRWSLTPPFHPYRLAAAVCFLLRFPSAAVARRVPGLDDRALCPAESGLSSPFRARPVTHVEPWRNLSKIAVEDAAAHRADHRPLYLAALFKYLGVAVDALPDERRLLHVAAVAHVVGVE